MRGTAATAVPDKGVRQSGFTLIELVVSMVILGFVSITVIGVILTTQTAGVTNRSRIAAANLATREMEIVRELFNSDDTAPLAIASAGTVTNPDPLIGGTAGQPLEVDGTPYTVVRRAQWNATGSGASACEGGTMVTYPSLSVTVTVTWPAMGNTKPVVSSTTLAPAKDVGMPTTGSYVTAKVVDQAAAPLADVAVDAIGGGTTVHGKTDESGCVVIPVTPATSGTTYTIQIADTSYVDISGTTKPSKSTGVVMPSTVYSGAIFSIAKPGKAVVTLERSDGGTLTDAQAAGSTITLVASQYAGASGATPRTVTGVTSTFTNLWPTTYGAYFGTVAPPAGYAVKTLEPGGQVELSVTFAMASTPLTGLPSGASQVYAVAAGTAVSTCPPSGAISAAVSGGEAELSTLPGTYDLYAKGATFGCSPGPKNLAVGAGDNTPVAWGSGKLVLTGVPSGSTLWAVAKTNVTGTPNTCPAVSDSSLVVNIDAAAGSGASLPAGDWYYWRGDKSGTPCLGYPYTQSPVAVAYGTTTSLGWAGNTTVTVTGMSKNYYFFVTDAASPTCKKSAITSSGNVWMATDSAGNPLVSSSSVTSMSVVVPRPTTSSKTYYLYESSTTSTGTCTTVGNKLVTNVMDTVAMAGK